MINSTGRNSIQWLVEWCGYEPYMEQGKSGFRVQLEGREAEKTNCRNAMEFAQILTAIDFSLNVPMQQNILQTKQKLYKKKLQTKNCMPMRSYAIINQ